MEQYVKKIKSIIPDFSESHIAHPFSDAGVDSMDLLTVRVEFENVAGRQFTDEEWLSFNSMTDIFSFCQSIKTTEGAEKSTGENITGKKRIQINMPQMAIGALSENWLFKEIGDTHWDLLCAGLNTPSLQLKDDAGNRLYATFVRIRMRSTIPLNRFVENEQLQMDSKIMRFGNGMYFSDITLDGENGVIEANLMTSFSIRNETDNTKLMKSQPAANASAIAEYAESPAFGNDYRLIKKGVTKELTLAGEHFNITEDVLFTTTYELNPYYDLNGVGLLYFAAYPILNNTCEARFFNTLEQNTGRWEMDYHIIDRDVMYFANCNINESIRYELNSYTFLPNDKVKISSTLFRESDNTIMARIFTIKQKLK
jgi:probable biosynthetic protein (TIGR04098 family)